MNISEETFKYCQYLMQGFSRHETMVLTDATSSRLAYLDHTGIIVPKKHGNPKKPYITYTWEQVIQIRAITHLKEKIPLALTKKIVDFIDDNGLAINGFDHQFLRNYLVIANDDVFVSKPDWSDMRNIMQAVPTRDDDQLTIVVLPSLARIVSDIRQVALDSGAIDMESFELRAKWGR